MIGQTEANAEVKLQIAENELKRLKSELGQILNYVNESDNYKRGIELIAALVDNELEEPQLKPCPFCGGEAEMQTSQIENRNDYAYSISCIDKQCIGAIVGYRSYWVKNKAIEAWNRRAT